jgi:endoglycosylceramidase
MRTLWLLVLCVGCSAAPYRATFAPLDSDGHQLRDAEGRVRILRGVNVKMQGLFDVGFDDGRAPREPLPPFDASDAAELHRLGLGFVRLLVNWSAIEPMKGQYSQAYLDRVQAAVDLCRAQNVLVMIDFHEDGFSKEICEDGAPLWAISPPLPMLTSGPVPGPDCHTAAAAIQAFNSFFSDVDGLQESYAEMAKQVAMRFRDDPIVIGYELMNEPIGDDDKVAAFHAKLGAALRTVEPKKLFIFEPPATRNFTNGAAVPSSPYPVGGGVYAVHIYTAIFGNNGALTDGTYVGLLKGSIDGARTEADGWGTPLMLTEFGFGPGTPNGTDWLGRLLDDADATFASTTFWHWKSPVPNDWGLFDVTPDGVYTERTDLIAALSRPYAQAIGGDATSVAWDGATLTVQFRARDGVPARHDVFWNQGTPKIACDGSSVSAQSIDAGASVYTVSCGGGGGGGAHTLTFTKGT